MSTKTVSVGGEEKTEASSIPAD